jgi:hypothetical protein
MKTLAIAIGAVLLGGCAIPTISTDFDPNYRRMHARTGTRIAGTNDLPRSWLDVPQNVRYADRQWLEDIIAEQRQLVPTASRACSIGSRCTGR